MTINIDKFDVVICSGNARGTYQASDVPNKPKDHIIEATKLPKGAQIIDAWYAPLYNIAEMTNFAFIDVNRQGDRQVKLTIAGYPGNDASLRIKVYILYKGEPVCGL